MAKFKVGDKIKLVVDTGAWSKGEKGKIIGGDYLPGYFLVKFDGGTEGRIPEDKMAVANAARNAKFKAGDRVKHKTNGLDGVVEGWASEAGYYNVRSGGRVYMWDGDDLVKVKNSIRSTIPAVNAALGNTAVNGADDAIIRLCTSRNIVETSKAGNLHEVRIGGGFVYPLVGKDGVLVRVFRSLAEAHRSQLLNASPSCNDKWIDDFHVIVTAGKPDASLVEALKNKASAWKAYRRNFSDKAASDAHSKTESEAMSLAKRLGARWIQQGAVLKVVMPNSACTSDFYD